MAFPRWRPDLLRLVARDWVDELDLATLEDRSSEFLDAAHRKRLGDMTFSVRLRRGRLGNGERPYLLVLLEFQSEVDRRMAKRVREYAEMLLERVARGDALGKEGGQPWVLPIVVYNGSEPWTAAGQVTDLAPLPSRRMMRYLALLQPQAYRLLAAGGALTSGAGPAEDWPLDNRVSATVRLQASGTPMSCCLACWRRQPASPARRTRRSGRRCTLGHGRCGSTELAAVRAFRPLRNLRERRKRLWRRWRKRLGTGGTPRCDLKALSAALLRALSAVLQRALSAVLQKALSVASGRAAPRLAYASSVAKRL